MELLVTNSIIINTEGKPSKIMVSVNSNMNELLNIYMYTVKYSENLKREISNLVDVGCVGYVKAKSLVISPLSPHHRW